jgi:hypothetical protein
MTLPLKSERNWEKNSNPVLFVVWVRNNLTEIIKYHSNKFLPNTVWFIMCQISMGWQNNWSRKESRMCRFDHNTYVLVGIYDRLFQKKLMQLTNTVSRGVSFISRSDGRPIPCSIHYRMGSIRAVSMMYLRWFLCALIRFFSLMFFWCGKRVKGERARGENGFLRRKWSLR